MNLELAQELKEAGYPQAENLFYWTTHPSGNTSVGYGMPTEQELRRHKGMEFYAAPMLADLIAACGQGFEALSKRSEVQWLAISKVALPDNSQGRLGRSPEEAVARLWLALNERQHD